MSHLNEHGITHLRHVDLAVPDYETQRTFYKDTWGLTEIGTDGDLSYLAAEGSPEQYVVRLRQADREAARPDLVRRRPTRPPSTRSPPSSATEGIQLVGEPGELQTAGGGYGFRFFDIDGRTIEISTDVETRQHRAIEEGEAIPVRISHAVMNTNDPNRTRDFYDERPRLQALGHALGRAHGRDDALHAVQRLAPQPGDRPRPAHLGPPRVVRDARPRRVHARHRPGDARRASRRSGDRAATTPATTRSPTSSTRAATRWSTRPSSRRSRPTRGTRRVYDIADPMTQDEWGTADPMSEIIARDSFNDPDKGVFVAPPV